MTYDSARRRIVLFGGAGVGLAPLGDTWEYDGSDWTRIMVPTSPPPRMYHHLAYDSTRSRTVLFGGSPGSGSHTDTWEYNGASWTQVSTPTVPLSGFGSTGGMVYDTARGKIVGFPGSSGETWEYDGVDWRRIVTTNAPFGSYGAGIAYDSSRGRVVWDGWDDTWEYDGMDWTRVVANAAHARRGSVVYDTARGCLVADYETWEYWPATMATWTRHGLGCAGSAGVPSLRSTSNPPALGTTSTLQLTALPTQPDIVYLAFGLSIATWNGAALPADLGTFGLPGCKLWIDPTTGIVLTHAGSSTTYQLRIPNEPSLSGRTVATQALVFDSAAATGIGAVSNAGVMRLY
jgi:hypothetical protein